MRLEAGLRGLRGFFLADPEDLSLLALVDQLASTARIRYAKRSSRRSRLQASRWQRQSSPRYCEQAPRARQAASRRQPGDADGEWSRSDVRARRQATSSAGGLLRVRDASIDAARRDLRPGAPRRPAAGHRTLMYGPATRVLLQFARRFWRARHAAVSVRNRSSDGRGLGRQRAAARAARHPELSRRRPRVARAADDSRERGRRRRRPPGDLAGADRPTSAAPRQSGRGVGRRPLGQGRIRRVRSDLRSWPQAWLARPAGPNPVCRRAHEPALAGLHERRDRKRPAGGRRGARPPSGVSRLRHFGELAPRVGVLRHERGEIERHVLRRELAATSAAAAFSLSVSGLATSSCVIRPSSCAMPTLSRKAAIIGRCSREVIVHERARGDGVREVRQRRQVLRPLLRGQRQARSSS